MYSHPSRPCLISSTWFRPKQDRLRHEAEGLKMTKLSKYIILSVLLCIHILVEGVKPSDNPIKFPEE